MNSKQSNLKRGNPAWRKGVSGNPGGRPKGIAELARAYTDKCIEVLAKGLKHKDPRVAQYAANSLLDRGYGKPLTMTADMTGKLNELDDAEIAAGIDAIREALASARAVRSGDEPPATTH